MPNHPTLLTSQHQTNHRTGAAGSCNCLRVGLRSSNLANLSNPTRPQAREPAPKPKGNLGTLLQFADQGETSDTWLAWGTVPHPDLERGMDENLEPLLGNRTGHTKISDVAIRSSDTLSLSSSNNVVRQDKVSHPHL